MDAYKILEALNGPIHVYRGRRLVRVTNRSQRRSVCISLGRFDRSFIYHWNQPCAHCGKGIMWRIEFSDESLILGCDGCRHHFRYPSIPQK